jgi:hypothetical protein
MSLQYGVPADPKEASMTPEPEANIVAVEKPLTPEIVEILDDQVIGDEAREKFDSIDDLDGYLDVVMLDQTMSIARAKKGGDLVAVIECPCEDHKIDLIKGEGFFLIDLADMARRTMDGMLKYADEIQLVTGCAGHLDCTCTLAEAMEQTLLPEELFCFEGHPNHLSRIDSPCMSHPSTSSGPRQVITNLCKYRLRLERGPIGPLWVRSTCP